ncbi:hypothetical protein ES319_A09G150200v1 [Gossypium barbadense]|uniref:MADS-box domain-containing protein n=2 Tax=Gossypium TaxID=3633 RepID=A0A5J5UEZ0_GOSBA|nr:hypothetical protein ES319_A09G150200v1 [Gossypium barbadense]TYH02819.1 hypothetical protein ES288_A09G171400v1 [Gossypium darwinii]
MTGKKVKLAWIENSSARKASLRKRRQGLVKKVTELTTLCGVEGGIVMYTKNEEEPIVWPSREQMEQLLRRFNEIPEVERMKKSMNLETYYKEMISKSQDQLRKETRKTKEMEVDQLMLQFEQGKKLDDFSVNELDDIKWYMETMRTDMGKIKEFYEKFPPSSVGPTRGDVPLLPPPPPPQGRAPAVGQTIGIADVGVGDKDTFEDFPWEDPLNANTNTNYIRGSSLGGAGSSSLHQPRPSHGGNSSIAPEPGLTGFSYGGNSSAAIEPRPPMPPFGYDSSSSVGTANPELPPFEPLSDDLLKVDSLGPFDNDMGPGHFPLGPLESSSPASDFGGNPLRFFGGESSSHGAEGNCETGPFDDNN